MPQSAWSSKDERKYEKIKKSSKSQGYSTKRAKEIAAATVNRDRSAEGRTKEQKGAGRTSTKSAGAGETKQALYQKARRLKIEGRSKMNKSQLARAVHAAR